MRIFHAMNYVCLVPGNPGSAAVGTFLYTNLSNGPKTDCDHLIKDNLGLGWIILTCTL